jgi:hypothetical protein
VGDVRVLLRQWFGYLSLLAVPIVLAGFLFTSQLAGFLHLDRMPLVILTCCCMAVSFYKFPVIGALHGLQEFTKLAVAVQSWGVLRLALGAGLVLWVSRSAAAGKGGQLIAYLMSIMLGLFFLSGVLRGRRPGAKRVRGVRRYVARSFFVLAGFAVLMTGDVVLVRHYLPEQAGAYAWASTIGRSAIFFAQPIAIAMFPKVTSAGSASASSRHTLLKAVLYSCLCIGALVLVLSLIPQVVLWIMFGVTDPAAETLTLVRHVLWAMSPLGLVFLLMNFELAQHRFRSTIPVMVGALAFVGGVALFHRSVSDVVACLAVVSSLTLVGLLVGLPWRGGEAAAGAG